MKVQIGLRLNGELAEWFSKLVSESGKDQSTVLREILEEYRTMIAPTAPPAPVVVIEQKKTWTAEKGWISEQPQPNPSPSTATQSKSLEAFKERLRLKEESERRRAEVRIQEERAITEEKEKRRSRSNRKASVDWGNQGYVDTFDLGDN